MEKEICPTPHWVISKLLENPNNWDISMLAPSKEEIPAEEQRQPDTLDRLFAIVEEQRKDIATLLAMMKDKDEKIEEMRRELDSLKRGVAQSAVGSSGANVG
jgi:K+/H+ antiporter YhaU regulatory subunit KhtT